MRNWGHASRASEYVLRAWLVANQNASLEMPTLTRVFIGPNGKCLPTLSASCVSVLRGKQTTIAAKTFRSRPNIRGVV